MSTKSFCKSRFPHKSVNLSFVCVAIKDTLTNLLGNSILQNDFMNIFCEIKSTAGLGGDSIAAGYRAHKLRHQTGQISCPNTWIFKTVECARETEIPAEQQPQQEAFVCDHACLVINRFSLGGTHPRSFVGVSQKSIFKRPCQVLAINAHKMAPIPHQRLQDRTWDTPTQGLLWMPASEEPPDRT